MEVERADHIQICRWYRFLPVTESKEQQLIMDKIIMKFTEGGGMNAAISKQIGWDKN